MAIGRRLVNPGKSRKFGKNSNICQIRCNRKRRILMGKGKKCLNPACFIG
jgi:hypothetical protein